MIINNKKDGHVHSPYCPHGTDDSFDMYIENAIKKGLSEISFTEHMPLPAVFMDEDFLKECNISFEQAEDYLRDVSEYKKKYKGKIKINAGFEVDYIEGYEEKIKDILNSYGNRIEDSLLSVHFAKYKGKYQAVDTKERFELLTHEVGSIEGVYDLYYNTVLKAVKSDLGKFKPKRIGHLSLIRVFNQLYSTDYFNEKLFKEILTEIKNKNYQIDFNTSGLRKPYCKETYPAGALLELIKEYDIDIVYGSDSHKAEDVASDFDLEVI